MTVSASTIAAIRFGYGFHPDQRPPQDAEDLLQGLTRGASEEPVFAPDPLEKRLAEIQKIAEIRKRSGNSKELRQMRIDLRKRAYAEGVEGLFQRAISPHGLYERLTSFWLDHFSVSHGSVMHARMLSSYEHKAIRANINGTFAEMLNAVARHPAMLVFLDQNASIGPKSRAGQRRKRGLNENLAREILELHTLGVDGPYTQSDVREFAELLTGFGFRRKEGAFSFFPSRAEPGAETVLGKQYGGDPPRAEHARDLFEDLAVHPATADNISRKLAVHFISDQPDDDLVRHIAAEWLRSGGDLLRVYTAMLEHPAAWRSFGGKVKQPQDLVISTWRATGMTKSSAHAMNRKAKARILRELRQMNQPIYKPPGPQGWPEDADAWITPQGLASRLDFAGKTGQRLAREHQDLDPRRFAEEALGDALRPDTAFAVGGAPERWEGLALVLASPEFNRR